MKADVTFTGQNGAAVASKPDLHVPGCGPVQTVKLSRAASPRPTLAIRVRRHPDGGMLARFSVTLPKQLRLNRSRVKRQATAVASQKLARSAVVVKGRTVTVSGLPKKGASTISLRVGRGALRLTTKARNKVRHGRKLKLRYKIVAVETDGDRFSSKTSSRPNR
jgi:hypothetical protein